MPHNQAVWQKFLLLSIILKFILFRSSKMEEKAVILEAMRKAGEPLNAGKIAELTGLDRKVVDKAMAAMKKTGEIVSPVRCKWEPAQK